MRTPSRLVQLLCLAGACLLPQLANSADNGKQTVCTITVNSADEKESFRRFLPASKYQFVELVEKGKKNWLASACQQKVSCDVLIVSGHYGEGDVFFSDALDSHDQLNFHELERVSCSDSCPSLFSNLKEVYLFGCNTLGADAHNTVSPEIARSLTREGQSRSEADRIARVLGSRHAESSRMRMRMVFKDVPAIYGFSTPAPLGPSAAVTLNRAFQNGAANDVGLGRASNRVLAGFTPIGMRMAQGMTAADPHANVRKDMCQFADDRLTSAQKLQFIHQLLQRPTAEARMFLDRIERYTASLDESERKSPDVVKAFEAIARDTAVRDRFLAFARDADRPEIAARMLVLSRDLGWLTTAQLREELVRMLGVLMANDTVQGPEVALACTLDKDYELDGAALPASAKDGVGQAAVRACLGNAEAHARVIKGLVSPSEADIKIAQAYLRHRPLADAGELRTVVAEIARMPGTDAQVRALDSLAQQYLSDRESLDMLAKLYSQTTAWPVQNAIAGILIRSDTKKMARQDLLNTLKSSRRRGPSGDSMVDALITRLQLP
jgi:hypothetical protein